MVPRIRDVCRDPRVLVLGLDDGLVPESDDFMLGRVRGAGIRCVPRPFRGRMRAIAGSSEIGVDGGDF